MIYGRFEPGLLLRVAKLIVKLKANTYSICDFPKQD